MRIPLDGLVASSGVFADCTPHHHHSPYYSRHEGETMEAVKHLI